MASTRGTNLQAATWRRHGDCGLCCYSSLAYLKRFAVDKLKIDQSFVRDIVTDRDDAAIVRAVIQMAASLDLKVVAEGVETEAVAAELRAMHCDLVQGYHFGRPMPAADFRRLIGLK
jgi:EAL domain-containing protein (putative c-di-GMP-specific phosphodiesterase class I)